MSRPEEQAIKVVTGKERAKLAKELKDILLFQVDKMLGQVDNIIKRLMNGLLRHQLDHCVNLIIIADHGNHISNHLFSPDIMEMVL